MKVLICCIFLVIITFSKLFPSEYSFQNNDLVNFIGFSYLEGSDDLNTKYQFVDIQYCLQQNLQQYFFNPTLEFKFGAITNKNQNPMLYFSIIPGINVPFLLKDVTSFDIGIGMMFTHLQGNKTGDVGLTGKILFNVHFWNIKVFGGGYVFNQSAFQGLGCFGFGYYF